MTGRYEIRALAEDDYDDLLELARHLDTVNLPNDPRAMRPIIEQSERSFSGEITDPREREYVFVLFDNELDRAIGTSKIIAQLGRRGAPYIFLDVRTEERYSSTIDKHYKQQLLSIGYSYDGPTEIGGLVMHPEYRRAPERLGMLISYVRFLFIAMRRSEFQGDVLAELLPPLESDGTSHLWEAVGKRFCGMTYREADRLSKGNKEFIKGLFPDGDIYTALLSDEAQGVIGKVGAQTKGVEKMLKRIGFRYVQRVDPFDGGPHFMARTDDVSLVRLASPYTIASGEMQEGEPCLIARQFDGPPYFRAVRGDVELDGDGATPSQGVREHLSLNDDDEVWILPLSRARHRSRRER